MKGLLMFDTVNDLAFLKIDKSLQLHLNELAKKEGLVQDSDQICDTVDLQKDVVLQLFAPLLASFKIMQIEVGNKYHSLETEDGLLILFHEILNYVVIGIRKAKEQDILRREISIFSSYVNMLYGPSLYLMKEQLMIHFGFTRLQLLSSLLDKWHQLRSSLQMFLVEAVERLIVSPEVTATCVNFLQNTLHKIRMSHREGVFSHSFLLVDCKLLALYSSRNSKELPKVQLLLLIMLANVLKEKTCHNITNSSEESKDNTARKVNSLLVFLKTSYGEIVPHIIYIISITNQVTLIILCEMTGKGILANRLTSLAETFDNLQQNPSCRQPLSTFANIDSAIKHLFETAKKIKLAEDNEKYIRNIVSKWELAKQSGIENYLKFSEDECLDFRLESAISAFCEASKIAFGEVITRPELTWEEKCLTGEYKDTFGTVLRMSYKQLKDYLNSEITENIALSLCEKDFPGLVNFIYIDRSNDFIIAQSPLSAECENQTLKKKVWDMVDFGWQHVNGVDSFFCCWHQDHHRYFYSIWFEDSSGRRIIPRVTPSAGDLPLKGILCGNFYKILMQKCFPNASYDHICSYELFCIHLETTSAVDVLEQARRLPARLWEYSGAYKNPLDVF